MIAFCIVNKYCKEDLSLIENYELALNDMIQTWDCHHRKEIDLGLSTYNLKEQGLYFNVPAKDLIFLTHNEHIKLHRLNALETTNKKISQSLKQYHKNNPDARKGELNPMYGKSIKDYMTEEAYNKWLELHKGENNPKYGIPRSEETKEKCRNTWKKKYENGYISPIIGHIFSEERNKKISVAQTGENNSMYGKPPANKGKHFNKNTRHYE